MNFKKGLISIIIPVYNVEKYLKKCVFSVINQKYENIEILIIDDGSTDNSGKICDEIGKTDNRIKVFHTDNFGVSHARNIGIEESLGEYIFFVDSDDYLSDDYCNYMLKLMKNDCDMGISLHSFKYKNDVQEKNDEIKIVGPEEGTSILLSLNLDVGCWNKIYKKDLIINSKTRFNENLFYGEGLQFITTLSQYSKNIGVGKRKVYYYRKNNVDSATSKYNIKKYINGEKSLDLIKSKLILKSKNVIENLNIHYAFFYINALTDFINYNNETKYNYLYKDWKSKFKKLLFIVLKSNCINLKQKRSVIFMEIFPKIRAKKSFKKRDKYIIESID